MKSVNSDMKIVQNSSCTNELERFASSQFCDTGSMNKLGIEGRCVSNITTAGYLEEERLKWGICHPRYRLVVSSSSGNSSA